MNKNFKKEQPKSQNIFRKFTDFTKPKLKLEENSLTESNFKILKKVNETSTSIYCLCKDNINFEYWKVQIINKIDIIKDNYV